MMERRPLYKLLMTLDLYVILVYLLIIVDTLQMLRAPITAIATIPFVFGLPVWPWMVHSQSFHLSMDFLEGQYREQIVQPFIRSLQEDSERSLLGTISASSQVAKAAVENALYRENLRYKRESDQKNSPSRAGMVQHMVALSSSLWAADSALLTIQKMLKEPLDNEGNHFQL
jgi:hypothetical protein